jgi:hypothetical protein
MYRDVVYEPLYCSFVANWCTNEADNHCKGDCAHMVSPSYSVTIPDEDTVCQKL